MPPTASTRDPRSSLEDLLVQEFRILQTLISVTKEERLQFPKNDSTALMRLVEQKESILDQFGLLEESRRQAVEEIARSLNVPLKHSALVELIPFLDEPLASRLVRLSEGITALANQARDLNYGNKAMAASALDWIGATQSFLLSLYQPQPGYRPPGMPPSLEQAPAWAVEHHA